MGEEGKESKYCQVQQPRRFLFPSSILTLAISSKPAEPDLGAPWLLVGCALKETYAFPKLPLFVFCIGVTHRAVFSCNYVVHGVLWDHGLFLSPSFPCSLAFLGSALFLWNQKVYSNSLYWSPWFFPIPGCTILSHIQRTLGEDIPLVFLQGRKKSKRSFSVSNWVAAAGEQHLFTLPGQNSSRKPCCYHIVSHTMHILISSWRFLGGGKCVVCEGEKKVSVSGRVGRLWRVYFLLLLLLLYACPLSGWFLL